jgi:hypothetical protein
MSKKYAPVVLFTYNRLDETMQAVQALQKNSLAEESELIIFSDGARDKNDVSMVDSVRSYVGSITGFLKVSVIKRDQNYGLAQNVIFGVTEIIRKYGKVIVLEDDLVTSKNFLCFMNDALSHYKKNNNIFSISGYSGNFPSLINYKYDTYLSYRPSSWGWATWEESWCDIDWDVKDFKEFVKNKKEVKKFNRGGIDMTRMLKHQQDGKNNSWAIRWAYAMYKKDKFCIYPKVSKVQNMGFGKDATHCTGVNIYKTILDSDNKKQFIFTDEKNPDHIISKEFRYQYSYRNKFIKIMAMAWLNIVRKL